MALRQAGQGLHRGGAPVPLEDKQLTLAFQSGEQDAYLAIYERYASRVNGVCRRMLGDPEDAQEAAQETFLRVYQTLGRFNGRYQLGAWITRIATNICLDSLRARSRRPTEVLPLEDLDLDPLASDDADPGTVVIRRAEGRRVHKVLSGLPPLHRAAIVLRDFEGFSYDEIAMMLDISECQVKALLHRARGGFRRSWSAGRLSALLPARLFKRVRRLEEPVKEQTTRVATSATEVAQVAATSPQALSCGFMFQQCGQLLGERAAPFMTAALVGTAAASGAAVANTAPVVAEWVHGATSATSSAGEGPVAEQADLAAGAESGAEPAGANDKPAGEGKRPAIDPEKEATDAAPVDSGHGVDPAPLGPDRASPDTQPAPPPPDPGGESKPPKPQATEDPSPTPPPPVPEPQEPQDFSFDFITDVVDPKGACSCQEATIVERNAVAFGDSELTYFDHVVTGTAKSAGGPAYGLRLEQNGRSGDHGMDVRLYTAEGAYRYTASGRLVGRDKTSWGGIYSYSGTYDLTGRPSKGEVVPERGTYTADVVISRRLGILRVRVALAEAFSNAAI